MIRAPRTLRHSRGIAMVLVVLAVIAFVTAFMLYSALGSVSKRLDAGSTSQQSFTKLNEALTRFVMANKRLPCPAVGTQRTGLANPDIATNTCNTPAGVVPWTSLGLSETDAIDPWGHYIAYRVYDGATGFTRTGGLDVVNCQDDATLTGYATGACSSTTHEFTVSDFLSGKGLTVNDYGTAKSGIAYVLISAGETGFGAYYPGATAPTTMPSASSKEFLNAGSAGTYWNLTASSAEVAADAAGHFDDYVAYVDASALAKASELPRPWPLDVLFDTTTVPGVNNYSTMTNSMKVTSNGAALGAVSVTASATSARYICQAKISGSVAGIAPCRTTTTNGGDLLTTSNSEMLTFDFHVKRTKLLIRLTDFSTGGNNEMARLTFYDGTTQITPTVDVTACNVIAGNIAQYRVTPAQPFTKVEVTALNKSGGGGSSNLAVEEIAACHTSTLATCKLSTEAAGYCP